MSLQEKNFDAAALHSAFRRNGEIGDAVEDAAPGEDLASAEVQAVAADLGLDREAANELMGACLRAAHEGEADPQTIRRDPGCSIIAVGMCFGVLAHLRVQAQQPWADEGRRIALWEELPSELRQEIGDRMSELRAERNRSDQRRLDVVKVLADVQPFLDGCDYESDAEKVALEELRARVRGGLE